VIKILTVSDVTERTLYPALDAHALREVELILSCGDLPPEYLASLVNSIGAPLYYVRGNHDIRYDTRPPQGCLDLHARVVTFRGLKILGLEGSMWYNGGPHQYSEQQMRRLIRRLRPLIWWRGGIDVVITHAPPRGIHDEQDLCHQGFKSFLGLIRKYKPRYFIHGHIHRSFDTPSERVSIIDATQVINTYGYHFLEIEDKERHS
jgi:Icc-related predicted phosphoesterase